MRCKLLFCALQSLNARKVVPLLVEKYGEGNPSDNEMFYSKIFSQMLADTTFLNAIVTETTRHSGMPSCLSLTPFS